MKITLILFAVLTVLLVCVLAIQIYSSSRFSSAGYELSLELKVKKLEKEIAEIERQKGLDAINFELKKVRLAESAEIQSAKTVKLAKISAMTLVSLWPFFPVFVAIGFFQYIRLRGVPIKMKEIETVVSKQDAVRLVAASLCHDISHDKITALGSSCESTRVNNNIALPVVMDTQKPIPTFREIVTSGMLKEGNILLGFDNDKPVYHPWNKCYSMAFGGMSGTGKTSTLRNLISQACMSHVDIEIIDGHTGADESLTDSIGRLKDLPNITTYKEYEVKQALTNTLANVNTILDTKKKRAKLLLIVMDELKTLLRIAPEETKSLIEKIGMETRKFNVYGLFASQSWPAKMFEGSEVRDNLVMALSHRSKKISARMLFDDIAIAKKVERLNVGEIIACGNHVDEIKLTVPYCSLEDTQLIYQLSVSQ